MSTNSYATFEEVRDLYPRMVESSKITPTELMAMEGLIENEIDGVLGTRYQTPFSAGVPPLVRTLAVMLTCHAFLRRQIIQESPSRSDWVSELRERAQEIMDKLVEGKMTLITGSGTPINPRATPNSTLWSSTKDYKPTFSLLPFTHQAVDQDRLDDESDRRA